MPDNGQLEKKLVVLTMKFLWRLLSPPANYLLVKTSQHYFSPRFSGIDANHVLN